MFAINSGDKWFQQEHPGGSALGPEAVGVAQPLHRRVPCSAPAGSQGSGSHPVRDPSLSMRLEALPRSSRASVAPATSQAAHRLTPACGGTDAAEAQRPHSRAPGTRSACSTAPTDVEAVGGIASGHTGTAVLGRPVAVHAHWRRVVGKEGAVLASQRPGRQSELSIRIKNHWPCSDHASRDAHTICRRYANANYGRGALLHEQRLRTCSRLSLRATSCDKILDTEICSCFDDRFGVAV